MEQTAYIYTIVLLIVQLVECADQPNQPPIQPIYYLIPTNESQQSQNQLQNIQVQPVVYYVAGPEPTPQAINYYGPLPTQPAPVQYYVPGPQAPQPVQVQYDGILQQQMQIDPVIQQLQYIQVPQPAPAILPQQMQQTFGPPQPIPIRQYDPYQQYLQVQEPINYGAQPVQQSQPQQIEYIQGPHPTPVALPQQQVHYGSVVPAQPTQQPYGPFQPQHQPQMPSGYQLPPQNQPIPIPPQNQPIPIPPQSQPISMQQFVQGPRPIHPQPTPIQTQPIVHPRPIHPQPTPIQTQPIVHPRPIHPQPTPIPVQPMQQKPPTQFRPPQPKIPVPSGPQQENLYLRGPQLPFPELREPFRPEINKGPGLLGPAPGPLRHPIYVTQGITSREQPIKIPHTKHQTERPTKSQPTKPEPSKPTKPSEPTEPSGTDKELQPERIPVEVGSDDETEEGAAGGGDDDDEGDEKVKPSEPVKKCEKITFMKRDNSGKLVEMTDDEYFIKWIVATKIKYVFKAKLEAVLCDEEVIFNQAPEKEYCKSMVYNIPYCAFIFGRSDGYVLVKYHKGSWKLKARGIPDYVELYTVDEGGNDVKLGDEAYYLKFTPSASFKFSLIPSVRLTKVVVKGETVWEKSCSDGFPISVSVTDRMNVLMFFNQYIRIYGPRRGKYRYLFTRPNLESTKH
ncbi:SVSP family protein [Theileria parva strain Muguga]|uniref:Theileria-specific sub-telomeric protein, SVSP family member n=1 Tax=Theileria parva TaxID=5875 RepID=Q4N3N1_THEPA|nr:SVSP family protein [Theileria parva strain Muguga]EAN33242.1 SVSP family protein [Theileria parva strain Muguga]|eukprot:XP_765525.1 hypothetical protein [Theileria parva strain Muguga]